jgi:hypothetical protein
VVSRVASSSVKDVSADFYFRLCAKIPCLLRTYTTAFRSSSLSFRLDCLNPTRRWNISSLWTNVMQMNRNAMQVSKWNGCLG